MSWLKGTFLTLLPLLPLNITVEEVPKLALLLLLCHHPYCRAGVCLQHCCFVTVPFQKWCCLHLAAKSSSRSWVWWWEIICRVPLSLSFVFHWSHAHQLPFLHRSARFPLTGESWNASQGTRRTSLSFPQEPLTTHRHRKRTHISLDCKGRKIIQIPKEIWDMKTCPFSPPKGKQIDFSSQFDLGQHAKHCRCCWALKRDRFLRNEDMSTVNVLAGVPLACPPWF